MVINRTRPHDGRIQPAALVAVLAILSGCAGEEANTSSTTTAEAMSTTMPPVTEPAPTTTEAPVTTTTTIGDTTSTLTATTLSLPPFPPERTDLEHGGDAWVVVLAADEDPTSPDLETAIEAARDAGFGTGATDCDFGAAAALGLPEDTGHFYTVSVYLRDETDARAALAAFQARGVDGAVALIQTYCMD